MIKNRSRLSSQNWNGPSSHESPDFLVKFGELTCHETASLLLCLLRHTSHNQRKRTKWLDFRIQEVMRDVRSLIFAREFLTPSSRCTVHTSDSTKSTIPTADASLMRSEQRSRSSRSPAAAVARDIGSPALSRRKVLVNGRKGIVLCDQAVEV